MIIEPHKDFADRMDMRNLAARLVRDMGGDGDNITIEASGVVVESIDARMRHLKAVRARTKDGRKVEGLWSARGRETVWGRQIVFELRFYRVDDGDWHDSSESDSPQPQPAVGAAID